jgi:hypothetical protein
MTEAANCCGIYPEAYFKQGLNKYKRESLPKQLNETLSARAAKWISMIC